MAAPIDLSKLRSLLIVKMSSIGDVVHALPVAVALRRRYPHVHISWAAEDWTAPLLHGHPAIDRVVVFPTMRWGRVGALWLRSLNDAVRSLRSETYDISVDLQGLMKSAAVALLSRAPVRIGVHEQREGAHLVSRGLPRASGRLHVVEDSLRCAELLGAPPTPVSFALPVQPEAVTSIARRLAELRIPTDAPLIAINPSASVAWKTWPLRHWARVADALSAAGTVILIGGSEQQSQHAALVRQATRPLHDLTGRTTLTELVALLDRCAIHIAPDTGSAHIAAALGRPVVSLYGPTPVWRKAPYGYEDLVVHGNAQCGVGCPRFCLRGRRCLPTAPDEIIARARHALTHAAPPRSQTAAGGGED